MRHQSQAFASNFQDTSVKRAMPNNDGWRHMNTQVQALTSISSWNNWVIADCSWVEKHNFHIHVLEFDENEPSWRIMIWHATRPFGNRRSTFIESRENEDNFQVPNYFGRLVDFCYMLLPPPPSFLYTFSSSPSKEVNYVHFSDFKAQLASAEA